MDVIEGRGPSPLFVLLLVQRLPDDSLTAALRQGGFQYFGWGTDRFLSADLYDAINLNTRATGNWRGKSPKFPEFPRPKSATAVSEQKRSVSVRDIYARLQRKV